MRIFFEIQQILKKDDLYFINQELKIYHERSFEIEWTVSWQAIQNMFTDETSLFGIIQSISGINDEALRLYLKPLIKGETVESVRPYLNDDCPSEYGSLCYH